jgi:cytochrome c
MKPPVAPAFACVLLGLGLGMSLAAPAGAQMDLARSRNCIACHQVDARGLGPSFREIAAKYAADAGAAARLPKRVREGGTGVWGRNVMPANPQVSEAEAEALVKWVLSQK